MVTPIRAIQSAKEITDPDLVKVVRVQDGRALYFSRSPVPHARNVEPDQWPKAAQYWAHIGVYGYRSRILEAYLGLSESPLEKVEKLEQLRFLDHGYCIQTLETEYCPIGVDTLEDLEMARQYFEQQHGETHGS